MIVELIAFISLCAHAGRALRVTQPYRAVAVDGEVRLRCSFRVRHTAEEMRVALIRGLHGEQQVCASSFNLTQSYHQTEGAVQCRGELSPGGVDLVVWGLTLEDTDLYRCRVELLYPPPYMANFGNGTLLFIPGPTAKEDCPSPAAQTDTVVDSDSATVILPVAALVFFILILIIIILTYKMITMDYRKRMYASMAPVISKRVDCRFGYENFL
ncbi:cytotoxic T-lymphocyte protein 4 [Megalops cyprinoides]|uniref:cytotoxic T-lymphocyte protein 4 n=1 Tax=Megalops cyprinoides TaxID=118141 RepID=UPI0018653785|nr:cytotoxic T-lymphocyte protein 4 [Megalops cyprinoides]